MGFETEFILPLDNYSLFARVAALDGKGGIIGSTPAVSLVQGRLENLDYPITRIKDDEDIQATNSDIPEPVAEGSDTSPSSTEPDSPGVPPERPTSSSMLSHNAAITTSFVAGAFLSLLIS